MRRESANNLAVHSTFWSHGVSTLAAALAPAGMIISTLTFGEKLEVDEREMSRAYNNSHD
jgi:hypothetical protein